MTVCAAHLPHRHSSRPSPSFPRRRETTGWHGGGRHAGFKAVSTGRHGPSCWLQGSIHRAAGPVILASRQYPQGGERRHVIADLIRNPEGRRQGGAHALALKDMKTPCLYIITNKTHGTLYVGVTSDLVQRIWQHKNGLIEGFSKRYGLKMLVWFEQHESMESAIVRERNVKYWRRDWKIQLIEESNPTWRDLYSDIL